MLLDFTMDVPRASAWVKELCRCLKEDTFEPETLKEATDSTGTSKEAAGSTETSKP